MMEAVADNELEPRQPGPPEPVPSAQPGPLDADQQRQFEEFRKFQEFQRYREETGQLPPAPKKPLWQRLLRSKLLRALVILLLIILGLAWAYQHYFGRKDS